MKKIRVTCGGCGIKYTDAHGNERHALKTAESGPFECDDAQADRLVEKGVAEYVDTAEAAVPESQQDEDQGEASPEPKTIRGHLDAADLETWDYNELKKLAADMGVKPEGQKKADYIAAIVAVEVEADADDAYADDDELPELGAADPE